VIFLSIKRVCIQSFTTPDTRHIYVNQRFGTPRPLISGSTCLKINLIVIFLLSSQLNRLFSIFGIEIASIKVNFDGSFTLSSKYRQPINASTEWMFSDVFRMTKSRERVLVKHFTHQVYRFPGEMSRELQVTLTHDVLIHLHSILIVMRGKPSQEFKEKCS